MPEAREKADLGVSDITFVSESQPQSNCTEQKKKARKPRRRAPIYWGKKPNKKKTAARRKLDADIDGVKAQEEIEENGEHEEADIEDLAGNSFGEKSAEEENDQPEEIERFVDANCSMASEPGKTDDTDAEEEDDEMMENGEDISVNGDVVLLDSETLGQPPKEPNSKPLLQIDPEDISKLPEQTVKNHKLFEKVCSLSNGVTEESHTEEQVEDKESDVECTGKIT